MKNSIRRAVFIGSNDIYEKLYEKYKWIGFTPEQRKGKLSCLKLRE